MSYDGVASANVVPRLNGKGTVGVYVAGVGTAVPDTLVQEIHKDLCAAKEINVDVTIASTRLKPINVNLEIAGQGGVNYDNLQAACEKKLADCFKRLAVGQNLLLSGIVESLYHTEGLYNYRLKAPSQDMQAASDELFTLGAIEISRMAVVI